jgi:hypothetical protein
MITGEQGAGKLASPVREGADGAGPRWAPRRRPTSLGGGCGEPQFGCAPCAYPTSFLPPYKPNLTRVSGTPPFPNPHRLLRQHGCAMIWIVVSSIMFPTRHKRVFLAFSTNYRNSSTPRRHHSRRPTRSRWMTSLCASGIPTAMSLRSHTTILRGRLPITRLLRPSLPPKQSMPVLLIAGVPIPFRLTLKNKECSLHESPAAPAGRAALTHRPREYSTSA